MSDFDKAAKEAEKALEVAESGRLRPMPLVHEGARAYPAIRPVVMESPPPLTKEEAEIATARIKYLLAVKGARPHMWFLTKYEYLAWVQGVLDQAYGMLVPGVDVCDPVTSNLEGDQQGNGPKG